MCPTHILGLANPPSQLRMQGLKSLQSAQVEGASTSQYSLDPEESRAQ